MSCHPAKFTRLLSLCLSCSLVASVLIANLKAFQGSRRENEQRRQRVQRPPEPRFIDYGTADRLAKISSAVGKAGLLFNSWVFGRALDQEVENVQQALEAKARRNGGRLTEGELYQRVVYVDPFGYAAGYQLRFIGFGRNVREAVQRARVTPGLRASAPDLLAQKGNFVFWGPGQIVASTSVAPDLSDLYGVAIADFIEEQREQIRAATSSAPHPASPIQPPHDLRGGPDPQRGRDRRPGPARDEGSLGAEVAPGGVLPLLAPGRPRIVRAAQFSRRITEFGTPNGRTWADFDGDGFLDLCVVLSDTPGVAGGGVVVTLSTGLQFEQRAAGQEIIDRTVNVGLPDGRAWVDVNKDRKADYCRVVGTPNDSRLSCTLSARDRFGATITSEKIDPGIKETRAWVDWDGDGIPDFVRVLDRPGDYPGIAITFGAANGFGPTIDNLTPRPRDANGNIARVEIAGVKPEDLFRFLNLFDVGYPEATLWMDANGDGKVDYIRIVGSDKDLVSVTLSNGRGFGLTVTEPLPTVRVR